MATVSQIIFDALPRLVGQKPTGTTFYQAINYISSMLSRRLTSRQSDLLVAMETTWTVTPATQYYNLPAGFVSLAENPFNPNFSSYDNGENQPFTIAWVEPITKPRTYYQNRTAFSPEAYELLGQQIVFYPALDPTIVSVSIKARYRTLAATIAGPADTIPFNGMFDQVFFQGVPRVVSKGLAVVQADPDFEKFLDDEVDSILNARIVPLPQIRTSRRNFM